MARGGADDSADANDSEPESGVSLEEAFSAIQEGSALEKKRDFWNATDAFLQAHDILNELAQPDDKDNSKGDNEEEKIRGLYQQQSQQYFFRARKALIQALEQESDLDQKNQTNSKPSEETGNGKDGKDDVVVCACHSLEEEEAQQRLRFFTRLFARKEDTIEEVPVTQQESSLEERLAALNKSLPSGFKTSDERMRDINQGLNRLGLSLHSNADQANKRTMLDIPSNKSEIEQVDDIIAQAKDEVLMYQQHPLSGSGVGGTIGAPIAPSTSSNVAAVLLSDNGDSDLSDKDEWDDNDEDVEFSIEDLDAIRDKVNEAQSSLAQLNALLEANDANENGEDDVHFDKGSAKKALRDARVLLQQATQKWKDT